jgi:hypothetical protein
LANFAIYFDFLCELHFIPQCFYVSLSLYCDL